MIIACYWSYKLETIKKIFPKDDIVEISFNYVFDQYHLLRFTWNICEKYDIIVIDPENLKNDLTNILFETKKWCKKVFLFDNGFIENNYKQVLLEHNFTKVQQVDEFVHGFC
jgi:hypothetical protein